VIDLATQLVATTRPLRPDLIETLKRLEPGQKIRITQTVRVGSQSWKAVVTGSFRSLNCLVTGLATERKKEDDIIVPTVHFTKDNGELSSVALDENSKVEIVE
jgi:hypothetical protein